MGNNDAVERLQVISEEGNMPNIILSVRLFLIEKLYILSASFHITIAQSHLHSLLAQHNASAAAWHLPPDRLLHAFPLQPALRLGTLSLL